jgi:hypothetical protein
MKDALRDEANKGDDMIPDSTLGRYIQNAVYFIEKNKELRYQEKFQKIPLEIPEVVQYPYTIDLPPNIKALRGVRLAIITTGAAEFRYLRKIAPEDAIGQSRGAWPCCYYTEAYDSLWLDAIPKEPSVLELLCHKYSGVFTDTDTSWLFEFGEQLVIAQAMTYMAPYLRSPELRGIYAPLVETELKTILTADEEFYYAGQDNRMEPLDWEAERYAHV